MYNQLRNLTIKNPINLQEDDKINKAANEDQKPQLISSDFVRKNESHHTDDGIPLWEIDVYSLPEETDSVN